MSSLVQTLLLSLSVLLAGAVSPESGRDGPEIDLKCDKLTRSSDGEIRCNGNVVLERAGMRFEADSLVAESDGGTLARILATGSPATFRQPADPETGSSELTGSATQISYDRTNATVEFREQAKFRQGTLRLSGNRLLLNLETGEVEVDSEPGDQVEIIVKPDPE